MTFIFSFFNKRRYLHRVAKLNKALGIMSHHLEKRALPVQMEADSLVSIGFDIYQREQRMLPAAARAWHSMVESAAGDGIMLQAVSAYRSVDYQAGIVSRKLDRGENIGDILRVSAAPGYSEHHTGRAIDVTTPGAAVLEEAFDETEAFCWLTAHAADFGFSMSFPRGNPHGVAYEPWHWAWKGQL